MNYLGEREQDAYRLGFKREVIITAVILFTSGFTVWHKQNVRHETEMRNSKKAVEIVSEKKYKGELDKCKWFVKLASGSDYDDVVRMQADVDRIQGMSDGE